MPARLRGGDRRLENLRGPASRRTVSLHSRRKILPEGAWLAPGFIDVQVNGGGDVLFNDEPTVEGIAAIAAAHRKFGTTAILPTLITDTQEKMQAALYAATRPLPKTRALPASTSKGRSSRRKSRAFITAP